MANESPIMATLGRTMPVPAVWVERCGVGNGSFSFFSRTVLPSGASS